LDDIASVTLVALPAGVDAVAIQEDAFATLEAIPGLDNATLATLQIEIKAAASALTEYNTAAEVGMRE